MPYNEWLTDPRVLERVRKTFDGKITLDPASNVVAQKYVQAEQFCISLDHAMELNGGYLLKDLQLPERCLLDGLAHRWHGDVFCNPPYSGGDIQNYVEKAMEEWAYWKEIRQMIFLVNMQSDAAWFHSLLYGCTTLLIWKGRIKFWKIFDGEAHEKWEGEKSKAEGRGKKGNSPRYLNAVFYFGESDRMFRKHFADCGTFVSVK